MATGTEVESAGAPSGSSTQGSKPGKPAQAAAPSTANPPAAASTDAPKLSNAELKAKAKAEKAARRAQAKTGKGGEAVPAGAPTPVSSSLDVKGSKPKGKEGSQLSGSSAQPQQSKTAPRKPSMIGRRPSIIVPEKDARSTIPAFFSHLAMAKRISTSQAHKDVHPAVLAVGQQMATFTLRDSIARLEATLLAFRKVRPHVERLACLLPEANQKSRLWNRTKRQRATHSHATLCPMFLILRSSI